MKSKFRQSYHGQMLLHVLISGAVTCAAEIILVVNFWMILGLLEQNGYSGTFLGEDMPSVIFQVIFCTLAGIILFTLCFCLLQRRSIRYVRELSEAVRDIADGDLTRTVKVDGDDEFAEMASLLNRMAEEIKVLMAKERDAERTKNELITNVAHDLRTPLTSVIGYLELLTCGNVRDEETRNKYLEIACQKSRRLQNLIEELFGFTKLTYGTIAVKVGRVDLVKLLEQLLDEFYPQFTASGLTYEYKTDVPSLMMNGDGNLLARLFDNLINNAIKYGADGKLVRVVLRLEDQTVAVQVINFGYVIPPKDLAQIFNKFYRVERARSSQSGGTGLGLAIARNIAELHGGSIDVSSDIRGTVFEVKLPTDYNFRKEGFEAENELEQV